MSLARYLASLLNSSGQIAASKLASGAAVGNIGYTPPDISKLRMSGISQSFDAGSSQTFISRNVQAQGGVAWSYDSGDGALRAYSASTYMSNAYWMFDAPVDSNIYPYLVINMKNVSGSLYVQLQYADGTNSGTWDINAAGTSSYTDLTLTLPANKRVSGFLMNSSSSIASCDLRFKYFRISKTPATSDVIDLRQEIFGANILQAKSLLYTDTFIMASANTNRVPVTNFYLDITPSSARSKIIVTAHLSVGFSNTPEWSWYVDRTIGGTTTVVGSAGYVGNRMLGYQGGPQDGGHQAETDDIYSFSHQFVDSPGTTSSIRYQVCMQDKWSNGGASYINRSGNDANTGYTTRGASNILLLEVAS